MTDRSHESRVWWGEFEMQPGKLRRWRIGPATVVIERRRGEWVIAQRAEDDPYSEQLDVGAEAAPSAFDDFSQRPHRFAGDSPAGGDQGIALQPRLADRDVVSRPEDPFSVLPGSEITVYVGSPVWLALESQPGARPLVEFPLVRPSDTWFGPNTRLGELCYASRTRCRLRSEDVRWNPHRAVTEVTIRNPGDTPLPIARINVPVPVLSLWVDHEGLLRTSGLVFTRKDDDEQLAELELATGGPVRSERLADARLERPRGLVRAFSQLI